MSQKGIFQFFHYVIWIDKIMNFSFTYVKKLQQKKDKFQRKKREDTDTLLQPSAFTEMTYR